MIAVVALCSYMSAVSVIQNMERGREHYFFSFSEKVDIDCFKEWQEYLKNRPVNIGLLTYPDVNTIHVYQAKFTDKDKLFLRKGRLPKNSNESIGNYNDREKYTQVGTIAVPDTVLKWGMYNLSEVTDICFTNHLFIQGSKRERKKTELFLKKYGVIKQDKDEYSLYAQNSNLMKNIMGFIILLGIVFAILKCLTLVMKQKKVAILVALGKRNREIYILYFKEQLIVDFFYVCGFAFASSAVLQALGYPSIGFPLLQSVCIICGFCIMVLVVQCLILKRQIRSAVISQGIKGRRQTRKWIIASSSIVIIFAVVILLLFSRFGDAFLQIQKLNVTAKTWEEKTRGIYSLGINSQIVDGTKEEVMDIVDRLAKLYDRLQYNHHTFFVDADNFLREKGKIKFGYEENIHKEEDVYSMDGACLVVNNNYFAMNSIELKANVQHSLVDDKNTLNVVVPRKLKTKEAMIKRAMAASFYAYKIEMTNERREEEGKPFLNIKKEDLKINVIYVNNN